jgi:hypothetical protein
MITERITELNDTRLPSRVRLRACQTLEIKPDAPKDGFVVQNRFPESHMAASRANRKLDGCAGILPGNKRLSDPSHRDLNRANSIAIAGSTLTLEWGRSYDCRNRPGHQPLHKKNRLPRIGTGDHVADDPRSQDKIGRTE